MSQQQINRSPDLKKLRDEGFEIQVVSNHLIMRSVPYVDSQQQIRYGTLISELSRNAEEAPNTHVVHFDGDYPCNKMGAPIRGIRHQSGKKILANGVESKHSFSNKPQNGFKSFYDKMTNYVRILEHPAQAISPSVTARTFAPVPEDQEEESVFQYVDTASSRAEIFALTQKFEGHKLAIVGLGGTGSYILDLVSKVCVQEIHIYDGDKFLQHNAFRAPGSPSMTELERKPKKVTYWKNKYSKMHKNIIPHGYYIDQDNVSELAEVDFVFLSLDDNETRKLIIHELESLEIPYIDVGMGLQVTDNKVCGIVRTTTASEKKRDHILSGKRINFGENDENNEYAKNIQISDLNCMNAVFAVIKWKKMMGFYHDFDHEHHSTYTIDGNHINNEEKVDG